MKEETEVTRIFQNDYNIIRIHSNASSNSVRYLFTNVHLPFVLPLTLIHSEDLFS